MPKSPYHLALVLRISNLLHTLISSLLHNSPAETSPSVSIIMVKEPLPMADFGPSITEKLGNPSVAHGEVGLGRVWCELLLER